MFESDHNTDDKKIDDPCIAAAYDVIERAKQHGTKIVIWRDNKIVRLTPEEAMRELE